jgi:predicted O-methyltransferase YrrM
MPTPVANALASRILAKLVDTGALDGEPPDWDRYLRFRERVRACFEVPGTTITPLMARVFYGIAALARPRRILGIGTYAGNALVWLAGPGFGPDPSYRGTCAVGVDTDEDATLLARENFGRLGADSRVRLLCLDGHRVADEARGPWDLLLLDADDPVSRKGIYLSLLDALYPHVAADGLVLAHDINVPLFREDMSRYRMAVSDEHRFRLTVPLEIDECGLEVSVKNAAVREPAAAEAAR